MSEASIADRRLSAESRCQCGLRSLLGPSAPAGLLAALAGHGRAEPPWGAVCRCFRLERLAWPCMCVTAPLQQLLQSGPGVGHFLLTQWHQPQSILLWLLAQVLRCEDISSCSHMGHGKLGDKLWAVVLWAS